MGIAEQWERIEAELPAGWADAHLRLAVADEGRFARAAALLAPLAPGRFGRELRLAAVRRGSPSPEAVRRSLARLDDEGIEGELALLAAGETPIEPPLPRPALAPAWDAEVAGLPPDWSDVYAEIELTSTDHLEPAALLTAPLNPARYGPEAGFRFRCGRHFGYGASPGMVRRCLERLDRAGIPGEVRVLRALSGTRPVGTQGPVWYLGGKVV